jgi:hypothetical protein
MKQYDQLTKEEKHIYGFVKLSKRDLERIGVKKIARVDAHSSRQRVVYHYRRVNPLS